MRCLTTLLQVRAIGPAAITVYDHVCRQLAADRRSHFRSQNRTQLARKGSAADGRVRQLRPGIPLGRPVLPRPLLIAAASQPRARSHRIEMACPACAQAAGANVSGSRSADEPPLSLGLAADVSDVAAR